MSQQDIRTRRGPKPNLQARDNLLHAGMKMFHASGFTSTGVKDVVDAASVPKGSFYNHFASKEAFGKEVVDRYFDQGLAELRKRFSDPGIEPLQRLRGYFEASIQRYRATGFAQGCMLGNMSLEVADHSTLIRESLAAHFGIWSELMATCIREAQHAGALRNPLAADLLAQFILNSWEGALLRMRTEQSDAPLKDFIAVVFSSVLV